MHGWLPQSISRANSARNSSQLHLQQPGLGVLPALSGKRSVLDDVLPVGKELREGGQFPGARDICQLAAPGPSPSPRAPPPPAREWLAACPHTRRSLPEPRNGSHRGSTGCPSRLRSDYIISPGSPPLGMLRSPAFATTDYTDAASVADRSPDRFRRRGKRSAEERKPPTQRRERPCASGGYDATK